jgi:hypothetical protein
MPRRKGQEFAWEDFPPRKDEQGWHCRKCGVVLTGRKTSWCSRECERTVLLLCHWPYIRRCILRRDHYRCVKCGLRAKDVDHIKELADGGSFHDWANLQSLCPVCHKAKSSANRTARSKARKIVQEQSSTTTLQLCGETPCLESKLCTDEHNADTDIQRLADEPCPPLSSPDLT